MPNVVVTYPTAYGEYGTPLQPVSLTHPLPVTMVSGGGSPVSGLTAADLRSQASTFSSVASGTTSVVLHAATTNRNGLVIVNTDANILYVDTTGGTASSSRYSHALAQGDVLEIPFGYAGSITGAWAADGAGSALITEYTP